MSSRSSVSKYRWKSWYLLWSIVRTLVYGTAAISPLIAFLLLQRDSSLRPFLLIPVCGLLPIAIPAWFILIVSVGNLLMSYVMVSAEGLEIQNWPVYRVRFRWDTVETSAILGSPDASLRITQSEALDQDSIATAYHKLLGRLSMARQREFYLRNVQGYPNGPFAEDLHRYVSGHAKDIPSNRVPQSSNTHSTP